MASIYEIIRDTNIPKEFIRQYGDVLTILIANTVAHNPLTKYVATAIATTAGGLDESISVYHLAREAGMGQVPSSVHAALGLAMRFARNISLTDTMGLSDEGKIYASTISEGLRFSNRIILKEKQLTNKEEEQHHETTTQYTNNQKEIKP